MTKGTKAMKKNTRKISGYIAFQMIAFNCETGGAERLYDSEIQIL